MKYIILSAFLIGVFTQSIAQETEKTEGNLYLQQVSGDTYLIKGKGGNIGVHIGEEEVLMIDSQFEDASKDIMEKIKIRTDKPIKYLVNTHHHGDHIGGNENFSKEGTIVFAHENARKNMTMNADGSRKKISQAALPVVAFNNELSLFLENSEIMVFHLEHAHTDGDVAIYIPSTNVMHTGDAFVSNQYPYIDLENGGSIDGYLDGLKKIQMIGNNQTKIIPGHGDVADLNDIKNMSTMLVGFLKRIRNYYVQGKTEEQIVAMNDITATYDDRGFGDGFISGEKLRRTLYKEVVRIMEERGLDSLDKKDDKQG